jgi:hypothetical protein
MRYVMREFQSVTYIRLGTGHNLRWEDVLLFNIMCSLILGSHTFATVKKKNLNDLSNIRIRQ